MDPNNAGWALSVAVFLPAVGAALLALMPSRMAREIKWAAVGITGKRFGPNLIK